MKRLNLLKLFYLIGVISAFSLQAGRPGTGHLILPKNGKGRVMIKPELPPRLSTQETYSLFNLGSPKPSENREGKIKPALPPRPHMISNPKLPPRKTSMESQLLHSIITAILENDTKKVERILKQDMNLVTVKDQHGESLLHIAAENGYLPVVKLLIDNGANIYCKNQDWLTPLHLSLKNGNKATSIFLLEESNLIIQDKNGQSPLHYAVKNEDLYLVDKLLQQMNKFLEQAAQKNSSNNNITLDLFGTNIEFTGNNYSNINLFIDIKDKNGHTPLNFATLLGFYDIAIKLLENGASAFTKNNHGWSLLFFNKSLPGQTDITLHLIEKYNININTKNNDGDTALHYAAISNNIYVAKALLESGKIEDINERNHQGFTPLHFAAKRGNIEMIKLLIENNAKLDIRTKDKKTAYDIAKDASYSYETNFLTTLLEPSYTSLHFFVALEDFGQTKKLLEENSKYINSQDSGGFTPLHIAVKKRNNEIVNLLLAYGAKTSIKSNNGTTAYQIALDFGDVDTAEKIKASAFPFHYAIEKNNFKLTKNISIDGSIDQLDEDGFAPLHIAAKNNNKDIIILLAMRKAKFDTKSEDNKTAQEIANEHGHHELAELLKPSYKLLLFATALNDVKLVNVIISNDKSQIKYLDSNDFTPLHIAVKNKNIEIVNLLLACGINTSIKNNDRKTAYQLALDLGAFDIAEKIKASAFPFHYAIEKNDFDLAMSIPTNGNINQINEDGFTPLHIAAKNNNKDIIILLAMREAKFDIESDNGKTAQQIAYENEHHELAKLLKPSYTFLHFAAALNDIRLAKLILSNNKYQDQIKALDSDGFTPFHIAAKNKNTEIVDLFNKIIVKEEKTVMNRLKLTPGFRKSVNLGKNTKEITEMKTKGKIGRFLRITRNKKE